MALPAIDYLMTAFQGKTGGVMIEGNRFFGNSPILGCVAGVTIDLKVFAVR